MFESQAAADYLIEKGISPRKIRSEICSYDTIGNAYFSRILLADPLNCSSCLVITSEFHMPRTKAIFNWIYRLSSSDKPFTLTFLSTPNVGLAPKTLRARIKRETISLNNLERTQSQIRSLQDLHTFIYEEHQAYAAGLSAETADGSELQSY